MGVSVGFVFFGLLGWFFVRFVQFEWLLEVLILSLLSILLQLFFLVIQGDLICDKVLFKLSLFVNFFIFCLCYVMEVGIVLCLSLDIEIC